MAAKTKTPALGTTLSVGEVAARSGISVPTLHFYESKGLIKSHRNNGNQRRYDRSVLRLISIIKISQHLGMSLEQIKDHLSSLPQDHAPTATEWKRLTKKWNDDLEERIKLLQLLQSQLASCIGCGCMSLKECPLRNPEDRYGKKGTGAQRLKEQCRI